MENDFNANNGLNDQSHESDGDSITIDNNDYEEYSDEFQIEENAVEDKKEENDPIKEKKPNPKSQKNKPSQQIQKNKKSRDMRTENNENMSQEEDEPLKAELQEKLNKVFLNYSKFNVQEENFILSHQYFMKNTKNQEKIPSLRNKSILL